MKREARPQPEEASNSQKLMKVNKQTDPVPAVQVRLLTVADIHQSKVHYRALAQAVAAHKPDAVAIVGDALYALGEPDKSQFTVSECAKILADLPVEHLLFVRGNHEDSNWSEFVAAWPHQTRALTALYGTACSIGPLVVVGFPCMTGDEFSWCAHLSAKSNTMELCPAQSRDPLPVDTDDWLPRLLRKTGPAGRTLWLMHESPVGLPLAKPEALNSQWTTAVEQYSPRLVLFGHDHESPIENGKWHTRCGTTLCVNVGQGENDFHYGLIDFEFTGSASSLPSKIKVQAFPWGKEICL
jgi:Icc-related predicted phosphoesterase